MKAAIELEAVTFGYPGSDIRVGPVDVRVAPGEMLAILGPNGSGKTTLLRLMSGLLRPDGGRLRVLEQDPARGSRRELARRLAVVGQQAELGFPYSVLEVVLMGRAPHLEGFHLENAQDLAAAESALEATGLVHLAGRRFDTLSSGERQRVVVARALAQAPEVLLLDEPAAHLDIRQQTSLYDLMADLNRTRGLTVVSVLHDLNLASLYFGRVAMLRAGRLAALGAPEDVITYTSIREVFDTDVYVDINDLTGKLNVLPLPGRRQT